MKRVLFYLMILLMPLPAWAMTPVQDADLSNVTGQAGVNINPDLTMDITINTMAWGDSDGITGVYNPWENVNNGGYIGVTGFNITNLKVRLRGDDGYNSFDFDTQVKPITIDVATGDTLAGTDVTFVRFGLGALQITMDELQFDVSLGAHGGYGATPDLDENMGVVTLGAMDVYINPYSYVDIYSHAGSGVNFDLNVTLDRVVLPYLSWGDRDGLPGGITSGSGSVTWATNNGTIEDGYIGLADFRIGDELTYAVKVTGSVAIDIASTSEGTYSYLCSLLTALSTASYIDLHDQTQMSELYQMLEDDGFIFDAENASGMISYLNGYIRAITGVNPGMTYTQIPLSIVHISFPTNLTVDVAKMVGRVILTDNPQLNWDVAGGASYDYADDIAASSELGDFYLEKVNVEIGSGSWVDIWAH